MRLAENESRRVGMKFEALVELSREAEGNATSRDFNSHSSPSESWWILYCGIKI